MVPGRPPLGRPGVGVLSLAALVLLGGCDLWPRHNPKDRRCNSGSCSRPEAGAPDLGADADLGPADLGHDRGADAPAVTPDRGADAPDMIPDLPGPDATPDQQPKLDTGCSVCPDGGCSGCVWTLAGTGQKGSHDDIASKATFNFPEYIALDKAGKLYVVDQENHSIRVVHAGKVTTLTGQAGKGHLNGTLKASKFDTPKGIVVASNGKIYVSDHGNNVIRKISISGDKVETVAGVQGLTGTKDGLAIKALFNKPRGLAMADGQGEAIAYNAIGDIVVSSEGDPMVLKRLVCAAVGDSASPCDSGPGDSDGGAIPDRPGDDGCGCGGGTTVGWMALGALPALWIRSRSRGGRGRSLRP